MSIFHKLASGYPKFGIRKMGYSRLQLTLLRNYCIFVNAISLGQNVKTNVLLQ